MRDAVAFLHSFERSFEGAVKANCAEQDMNHRERGVDGLVIGERDSFPFKIGRRDTDFYVYKTIMLRSTVSVCSQLSKTST
jgi:hypothetical protein